MLNTPPARNEPNQKSPDDGRLAAACAWAREIMGKEIVKCDPVVQDASFRRYFRLATPEGTVILMDAPPQHENSAPFLDIASRLRKRGLHAPEVFHFDLGQGFGLIEDLGDKLYREVINPASASALFPGLFRILARMAKQVDSHSLPEYDAMRLQTELDLFVDWYLLRHRQRHLNEHEMAHWHSLCKELKQSAAEQPQVFVHRDFHSCNLLYREGGEPGIIDFQDAVRGPLSYDFVSLLWDRYIEWPREQLENWMDSFRESLDMDIEPARWRQWCDMMGLQRNLKIVGIFSRLYYRDGKSSYLPMIPRFYGYVLEGLGRFPQFRDFLDFMEQPECVP